ncbi:MAG: sensor histidine kinase [Terrimicrobiaceae bacterium]|nr:sensor histidine kinase [Terrimicrobiaceae bacterium]
MSVSLLFLVPILLITAATGLAFGVAAAVLAAGIWLATDVHAYAADLGYAIPIWNAFMRLGTFLVAVWLVASLKTINRTLEARVTRRTAELNAKLLENSILERRILEVSDEEQARIGQDLHDGLGQQLVSLAFSLNLLRERVNAGEAISSAELARLQSLLDDAISQTRDLARGLFPASLETEGLEIALRQLASGITERSGIECRVECAAPLPSVEPDVSRQLFRIAQEAISNAVRHAAPTLIRITLSFSDGSIRMAVVDNGRGLPPEPRPDGMGMRIMAYRARMIGAGIQFETGENGRGRAIHCRYRCQRNEPA